MSTPASKPASPTPSHLTGSASASPPRPACCVASALQSRLRSESGGEDTSDPPTLPAAAINALRRRHFQLMLAAEGGLHPPFGAPGSSAHSSGAATPVPSSPSTTGGGTTRSPSRQQHVQHVEPALPAELHVPGVGPNRLRTPHHSWGGSPLGPPVEGGGGASAAVAAATAEEAGAGAGGGSSATGSSTARSGFGGAAELPASCAHCGAAQQLGGGGRRGSSGSGTLLQHSPGHGSSVPFAVLRARLHSLDLGGDPPTDPFKDRSSPRHSVGGCSSGRVTPPLLMHGAGSSSGGGGGGSGGGGSGAGGSGGAGGGSGGGAPPPLSRRWAHAPTAQPRAVPGLLLPHTLASPSPVTPDSRSVSGRASPVSPVQGLGGGEGFFAPVSHSHSPVGIGMGGLLGTVQEAAGATEESEGVAAPLAGPP